MKILIDSNDVYVGAFDIVIESSGMLLCTKNLKNVYYPMMTVIDMETIPEGVEIQKNKYINNEFVINEDYQPVTENVIKKTRYDKDEFIDFFTKEEILNIWNSTNTDVQYFIAVMTMKNYVDLTNQDTINAMGLLLSLGLMSQTLYDTLL